MYSEKPLFDQGPILTATPVFLNNHHLRVGEVDFDCSYVFGDADAKTLKGFMPVAKDREQIERYLRLRDEFHPDVIVELGIQQGGSTALLHALFQPLHLLAIELASDPAPALSNYIQALELELVIRPHYGVNQADRAGVASIMATELAGQQIDLVIDDASHLLEETRISFEILFPLMRSGGLYVIEDWNAEHLLADGLGQAVADTGWPGRSALIQALSEASTPVPAPRLLRLPLELVLARARAGDVIREVTIMNNWVVIQRGEQSIDPASFRLTNHVQDHFANLRSPG